jgi:hypothetical protein
MVLSGTDIPVMTDFFSLQVGSGFQSLPPIYLPFIHEDQGYLVKVIYQDISSAVLDEPVQCDFIGSTVEEQMKKVIGVTRNMVGDLPAPRQQYGKESTLFMLIEDIVGRYTNSPHLLATAYVFSSVSASMTSNPIDDKNIAIALMESFDKGYNILYLALGNNFQGQSYALGSDRFEVSQATQVRPRPPTTAPGRYDQ